MERREAEIARLGEEAARRGANADAMALQHRCEAQEGLILQLTEQVTSLQMLATATLRCSHLSALSDTQSIAGHSPAQCTGSSLQLVMAQIGLTLC